MSIKTTLKVAIALGGAFLVTACDDTKLPGFLKNSKNGTVNTAAKASSARTTERDVEAPDVFQVKEKGLWDGRPSLGGVWVAHPTIDDPERVVILNTANNKSVVGAIFRRERDVPGPRLQVSSDAAAELGLLAGAPVELRVTALRKEKVVEEPEVAEKPALENPEAIAQTSLDDPIAAAEAALDRAEGAAKRPVAKPAATPAANQPAKAATKSTLSKPFVQIGMFALEKNANDTAQSLRGSGLETMVKPGKSNGKDLWRVLAGPAATRAERAALLKQIKKLGFADAYFVKN